ncbi:hypothetical protein C5167_018886 [Papaver somniferum]|uniref:Uncharacterized protein n=1 Tax=Papaver somniferum TaxID=3469 RepID=A0A4Y7IP66_PAPSO|nr:hypothetical protein C5167_018886 [Papaver somniferum]
MFILFDSKTRLPRREGYWRFFIQLFACDPSNEEKTLPGAENKVCNSLLETEDNDGENINLQDSNADSGFDLCVPNTLELLHSNPEVIEDSDEEFYKEKSCN